MFRTRSVPLWLCPLLLCLCSARSAWSEPPQGIQYFTDGNQVNKWIYYKDKNCYTIWWKYWDSKSEQYVTHIVYYFPDDPHHYYYYNPLTEKFWGRCVDRKTYSRLADKYQRGKLKEIEPSWFPEPDDMPLVPGTDERMEPPPAVPAPPAK
jgi:hypothetical protein